VKLIIQEEKVKDKMEIKKIKKRIKRKMKRHKKRWKGMSEKEKEDYSASKEIYLMQKKHKNSFNLVDDPNVKMELRKISDTSQAEQRISTKNQESRKKVEICKFNENASDFAKELPTRREPNSPGPFVKEITSISPILILADLIATSTTGTIFC